MGKTSKSTKRIKQSIGIIGAGPAGMACADELKNLLPSNNDRYDRPGGFHIWNSKF